MSAICIIFKNIKPFFILFTFILLLISCEDKIDNQLNDEENYPLIYFTGEIEGNTIKFGENKYNGTIISYSLGDTTFYSYGYRFEIDDETEYLEIRFAKYVTEDMLGIDSKAGDIYYYKDFTNYLKPGSFGYYMVPDSRPSIIDDSPSNIVLLNYVKNEVEYRSHFIDRSNLLDDYFKINSTEHYTKSVEHREESKENIFYSGEFESHLVNLSNSQDIIVIKNAVFTGRIEEYIHK